MKYLIMENSRFNKIKRFLYRLVCVPVCGGCGERLSPFLRDNKLNLGKICLCEKCLSDWQSAKAQLCHRCGNVAGRCTCIPPRKSLSQQSIPSLFFYHPGSNKTENRIIYTVKHQNNRELFEFLAKELCPHIKKLLSESGISLDECVFTYIPRSRKGISKNGFDQGKRLCEEICRELGTSSMLTLFRRIGGREQKKLDKSERKKNVKISLSLISSYSKKSENINFEIATKLEGKTVLIIDDIITTGESFSRCAKLLDDTYTKRTLFCCLARCEIAGKTKK